MLDVREAALPSASHSLRSGPRTRRDDTSFRARFVRAAGSPSIASAIRNGRAPILRSRGLQICVKNGIAFTSVLSLSLSLQVLDLPEGSCTSCWDRSKICGRSLCEPSASPPGTDGRNPLDLVHAAAVRVIRDVLLLLDVEPDELLRLTGSSSRGGDVPDAGSFAALGRLTALCAERTRCPQFGLMVGQRASLASLGLLGVRLLSSPDVRPRQGRPILSISPVQSQPVRSLICRRALCPSLLAHSDQAAKSLALT